MRHVQRAFCRGENLPLLQIIAVSSKDRTRAEATEEEEEEEEEEEGEKEFIQTGARGARFDCRFDGLEQSKPHTKKQTHTPTSRRIT